MKTQNWEEEKIEKIKEEQKALAMKTQILEDEIKTLEVSEKAAKTAKENYQRQSDQTEENYTREMASLMNGGTGVVASVVLFPYIAVKSIVTRISSKRNADEARKKLDEEQRYRRQRQNSIKQKAEFLSQMREKTDERTDYEAAVEFLLQACGNLRALSIVMEKASVFWMELHDHCQNLADDGIKKRIEEGMSRYSDEKRMRLWTHPTFISQGVAYFAKWVALHEMCKEYMGYIKETQRELYDYIKENPTREESKRRLRSMIDTYMSELSKEEESIKQSESEAEEVRKKLELIVEEADRSELENGDSEQTVEA